MVGCCHAFINLMTFFKSVAFFAMRLISTASQSGSVDSRLSCGSDHTSSGAETVARLSVSLPRSLYRQVKLHALDQDTTLSALLTGLIRKELV